MTALDLDRLGIEKYLERYRERGLLRFLTCGSVDDGKSTLIGRLLHDSQRVFDDQLAAARRDSERYGTTGDETDLALLVDGLQAEREQGITIDVAYRYFSTERRKFIIADTPGHEQYTRNMATGASHCDLAVILVDARRGVREQTRRHAFLATLLGIQHLVVAVNKMDLVDWNREVFDSIRADFAAFAAKLQVRDVHFIPMSALEGDNVVRRSKRTAWYQGSPLLDHLETVHVESDRNLIDLRLPVQMVLRADDGGRRYAGTVASGILRAGDAVVVLPSGRRTRVTGIDTFDGALSEAPAGRAVTVRLEDEVDAGRGDVLAHVNNSPHLTHEVEAMVVWMAEEPLVPGRGYLLEHAASQTAATVAEVRYRMDVGSLRRETATGLALNEIGRVRVETAAPIAWDSYAKNRAMGSFILIDRLTNATVGAGMIVDRLPADQRLHRRQGSADAGRNVSTHRSAVTPEQRAERLGQKPFTVWLTGLPRSGKTTVAYALEEELFRRGLTAHVLAGGNLRQGVNRDLGFSGGDRWENQRRAAEIARISNEAGLVTICALVSPLSADRVQARALVGEPRFVEVFCDAPLTVCEARDTDGLYEKARRGELRNVTGVDAPYEPPTNPDCVLPTSTDDVAACVRRIVGVLEQRGLLPQDPD